MITSNDFFKRLNLFELETIPSKRFTQVEKILESEEFDFNKARQLSKSLNKLMTWVSGVMEFHRVIRKYSLSNYDYNFLSEDEIYFCTQMDNIVLLYYKLLRYANTYCRKFEKQAKEIMSQIDSRF